MIGGLLVLLLCQLGGEVIVRLTGLPVPGPVIGMVLLLGLLRWRRPAPDAPVVRVGGGLLAHLQLLFVPAGVGVISYLAALRADALPIAGGLWVSWLVGIAATGLVVDALLRLQLQRGRR